MARTFKMKEVVYSASTRRVDGKEVMVYGTVSAEVKQDIAGTEVREAIITSRAGDKIHLSDLNALEGLLCVLNQLKADIDGKRIEWLRNTWEEIK